MADTILANRGCASLVLYVFLMLWVLGVRGGLFSGEIVPGLNGGGGFAHGISMVVVGFFSLFSRSLKLSCRILRGFR